MANAVSPVTRFRYRCLGPAELRGPAGRALPLRTRKHRALLYVLARKAGAPTSRDVLVELLWPDAGGARAAKHSLAQSASLINKALGTEVIVPAGKDLITMREGVLTVDALDFEDHAANGRAEEAFALWGGDLLEGLWVRGAPTFERYLADERERLRRVLRSVLKELIESRQRAGNWAGMRAAAEKLLEVDPLDEAAMLRYLEALILLDDRTLALRTYAGFEKRLREELEAEPGVELRSWVKRQRRGAPASGPIASQRVSERSPSIVAWPVLGRELEFGLLWDGWNTACRGRGSFFVLEGAAGIGKTALVNRLANQVTVEGRNVALVRCYATDRTVPFGPVTALVKQLSKLPGFASANPVVIAELSRLVPELRGQFPGAPQPLPLDELARPRVCDAALSASEAVASENSLLVVVDDIQNADEASLALIHYLGREAADRRMMLVCTIRSQSVHQEHVRTFVETSRRCEFASFVSLGGLDAPHIIRLGQAVLAQMGLPAPEDRLGYIVRIAQGNPLHAIEAASAMPNDRLPAGDGPLASVRHEEGPTFVHTAGERLISLGAEAKAILALLTVAGRPLSEYEVASMTGLRPAELEAGFSEGEAARFLRRVAGAVAFSHDEYAAQVEGWLGPPDRERAHGELADHLQSTAARNPAAHFEVAYHYLRSGREREALAKALDAARYAESLGAGRSMASALELALAVAGGADLALAVRLGSCYLALNDAAALAKLESDLESLHVDRSGDFTYFRLASAFQSGAFNCERVANELAGLTAHDASFTLRSDALLLLARLADKLRDYGTVRSVARRLRKEGPPVYGLVATAYLFTKCYWAERALRLMEAALALARAENRLGLEQFCLEGIGVMLTQVGRFRESARQFDYSLALARKSMNPQAEVMALNNRAVAEMALGDLDAVERTHAEADRVARAFQGWAFNHYRLYNDGLLKLLRFRFEDSARLFRATEVASKESGNEALWRCAVSGLALAAARRQDWHQARQHGTLVAQSAKPEDETACGWIEPAAMAWGACLDGQDPGKELDKLSHVCRALARRNVGHWLTLELESIYLREWMAGSRESALRANLLSVANRYEAGAIARAAAC